MFFVRACASYREETRRGGLLGVFFCCCVCVCVRVCWENIPTSGCRQRRSSGSSNLGAPTARRATERDANQDNPPQKPMNAVHPCSLSKRTAL